MAIELKMPALSPTMESGTLAKWLVAAGDAVKSGDILAEIETDKATMEFEAVDEGTIGEIVVAEGTDDVPVGTVIATLREVDDASPSPSPSPSPVAAEPEAKAPAPDPAVTLPPAVDHGRASPLARRIAAQRGIALESVTGTGSGGRIVKADVAEPRPAAEPRPQVTLAEPAVIPDVPHEIAKLSNMRRTIARRLTESKQQVPHIYLSVDVCLDKLLTLRTELNASLEARGIKLSVNDMLVKALAQALIAVPKCNVMFTPDNLVMFKRADISVAVSTPTGLITPIIEGAETRSLSSISTNMKDLAARARDGKLKPQEFQGGTASISNMGMYAIKQFAAVINPPQGMILAVGAGERRPSVVDDQLTVATVMSATGSFDHRAIDGADAAELMRAFREFVEVPLLLIS